MKSSHETTGSENASSDLYRLIPSLHELLLTPGFARLLETESRESVLCGARAVLSHLKREIADGHHTPASLQREIDSVSVTVAETLAQGSRYSLRRVINATGVVLHTNLGRAPLSAAALDHILDTARGYCNLEFDLTSGGRSRRDDHAEDLLLRVLRGPDGATTEHSAVVVNNCAAATFLALNTLAEGGEVIVSRGQLVEIGGGFRMPEILAKSGAVMREVGTTNRTRLADYENAISPATRLILRVHPSNFSMEGFVEHPGLRDLISLGKRCKVPVFDDQGTGLLTSLEPLGIGSEPTLLESFRLGSDLVAASGDKLLGGPQCGLLIGRGGLVQSIRKNPLYRAFRADKLTYAALEATLMEYASGKTSAVPVQRMLHAAAEDIFSRCETICHRIDSGELSAEPVEVFSLIGGGAAPTARLQSAAVSLRHARLQPQALLTALRGLEPPVIGRISEDSVLLDLRTVEPAFDEELGALLQQIAGLPDDV